MKHIIVQAHTPVTTSPTDSWIATGLVSRVPVTTTRRLVLLAIVLGTLGRLLAAGFMHFGVDEAYAVAVSQPVSASWFDHPPLVFWLAGFAEWLSGARAPLAIRAPFVLLFAGTSWFLYALTTRLYGERAGLWAVLVVSVCGVLGFSGATWVLPDGPLLFGLSLAAFAATQALDAADDVRWWLLVGLGAGLAGLSKYHAIFFPIAIAGFLITSGEGWRLRRRGPWLAALVAIVMVLPVFWWNATHDWASFLFQIGRAGSDRAWRPEPFLQNLAGQVGYVLPWVWIPLLWAGTRALGRARTDRAGRLLLWLAAGPLVTFTLVALLATPALPHWQGPGYFFLAPLLGAELARAEAEGRRWPWRWWGVSAVVFVLLVSVICTQTRLGWISRAAPTLVARGDPSLEAYDWHDVRAALDARGLTADSSLRFVAAPHWIDAAKLGVVLPDRWPVLALTDDARHFAYSRPAAEHAGHDGLLLRRTSRRVLDERLLARFASLDTLPPIEVQRGGVIVFDVEVYRVRGLQRD